MHKSNKYNEKSFKMLYIVFLSIITMYSILFISFILLKYSISTDLLIMVNIMFIILNFITAVMFIYFIRKKVINIFDILDNMISEAINEDNMVTTYDETLLSSLESKMYKYIKITKSNKKAIENERNKVKSLVADISHQTKTPIANIQLYSQLALENENNDDYTKEILIDINNQSERLNFLIHSLIKMSRLENGIISPTKSKSSIKDIILKSVQEIYINSNKKDINVNVECDKNIFSTIDAKWTIEAVVNILENAIKYTNNYGNISILVTHYELFNRIDIIDNGIGIEQEELNNIFKRFYRCKNAKNHEGVGIGLYLSREIISLQGGYIKVSSKLGHGSTFSVFLPV